VTDFAAAHIQHMQKALMEMNLQLHHVVSDITGASGMRIIRAIVAGERDPKVLAAFQDVRCKLSIDTIKAALVGNDREEHVFALTQSLELYDFYKAQIETCDRRLEVAVGALTVRANDDLAPLPKARIKSKLHNAPSFDVRAALYGVLGTDLTQIHGLGPSFALKLVAECGTDLRAWKSAKHFTSWLCLAPGNKISGGQGPNFFPGVNEGEPHRLWPAKKIADFFDTSLSSRRSRTSLRRRVVSFSTSSCGPDIKSSC
jgi:hypothetical protein